MNRARAAQPEAATELGAGLPPHVGQPPEQRRVVVEVDAVSLPVNSNGEGHGVLSFYANGDRRRDPPKFSLFDTPNSDAIRPEAWRRVYWTMVSAGLWHQSARQSCCTRSRDPTNSRNAIGRKHTNCLLARRPTGPEKPRWRDGHES